MPAKGWTNLREKAEQGDYDSLVAPLDFLILELLPDEGETVMGFYPMAMTVSQLRKERFGVLSPGEMSGALKRLTAMLMVVRVRTRGASTSGYQRTALGKQKLNEWMATQPKKAPDKSGAGGK